MSARPQGANAIGRAIEVLGDRWALLILREAFVSRTRRYQDWRTRLGISDAVLAGRLRDLVAHGVLERVRYGEAPPRDEYRLTERGLELWVVLVAVWAWERAWGETPRGAALPELEHVTCGRPTRPVLGCARCEQAVAPGTLRVRTGPGFSFRAALPPRYRRRSSKAEPSDAVLLTPQTAAIVADRWSAVIMGAALVGTRRFGALQAALGISPGVLSERLSTLVELAVLERTVGGEYVPTAKGRALQAIFLLVIDWGQRWMPGPEGDAIVPRHGRHALRPALACDACGALLERTTVRFRGPLAE